MSDEGWVTKGEWWGTVRIDPPHTDQLWHVLKMYVLDFLVSILELKVYRFYFETFRQSRKQNFFRPKWKIIKIYLDLMNNVFFKKEFFLYIF